jgi:hypothetical protein
MPKLKDMTYDEWKNIKKPTENVASQATKNKVVRDYNNRIAKSVGKDRYDGICDALDAAKDTGAKSLYMKYIDDVGVLDSKSRGGAYCQFTSISWNAEKDSVDSKLRKAPLAVSLHPLAWMLMLCDELQCWDRVAYGRNSRSELHPMAAAFDFSDGALSAVYLYDREEQNKIDAYFAARQAWESAGRPDPEPRLKAYSDMVIQEENRDGKNKTGNRFTADIEKIVDTGICPLHVVTGVWKAEH